MVMGYGLLKLGQLSKCSKAYLGIKFYIISYFCGRVQRNAIILYSIVS